MKKYLLLITLMMTPFSFLFAQTYDSLWREVTKAQADDLPKTEVEVLQKIAGKAAKEKAYGQLLKAELMMARTQSGVSPDTLQPAVGRLEARERYATDPVLKAVLDAVLGYVYQQNRQLADDADYRSADYYRKAMANPAMLAATKATTFEPLVTEGPDSRYFGDDLLSLMAYETGQVEAAHQYYLTTTNRPAQLFTALEMLRQQQDGKPGYVARLDSLADRYADLAEAGEVAIARYEAMQSPDYPVAARIAYIDKALKQWGSWKRIDQLRNARKTLTQLQFQANVAEKVYLPQREQTMKLSNLRGISSLTLNIYKVKANGDTQLAADLDRNFDKKVKPLLTQLPALTQTRNYEGHKDYEQFEDSIVLPCLPVGVYLLELSTGPATQISRQLYYVSNLRVLMQNLPGDRLRLVCVDATTGQPVKGAQVRISHRAGYRTEKKTVTVTTDARGEYLYSMGSYGQCEVFATTPADKACPPVDQWGKFSVQDAQKQQDRYALYTDRAIYRPGQTVHVAAIAYRVTDGFQHEALTDQEVDAVLRDANWQEVDQKKLRTDRFGTCSVDFVLPQTGLTGQFTVRIGNENCYIRVEEYKRPTFQVEFQKVETDYAAGDTVTALATARSYAGVPVSGASVHYKVVRRLAFWWMGYSSYWMTGRIGTAINDELLAEGELTTADDGTFQVAVPLQLPATQNPMFYNFVVTADVTDQAGETHQGQYSLPLGNRKTALTATLPRQVQREQLPEVSFHLRNAAGNDIAATVRYQIDGGKWNEVPTNKQLPLLSTQLKSGEHTLKAVCQQDTLEQQFVVFSEKDTRPAIQTDEWFWASAEQFASDGRPVTVQAGSSDNDLHVVYTLIDGHGNIVESGAEDKSDALINRQLSYKESYGNGLSLSIAWMKNGQAHAKTFRLQRPLPDKQLSLKWETFRDRLQPGQQEEWTLSVVKPDGQPADAQLMATLYDKSLDQITGHDWTFSPLVSLPLTSAYWRSGEWGGLHLTGFGSLNYNNVKPLQFRTFDHDCYPMPWLVGRRLLRFNGVMKSGAVPRMAMAKSQMAIGDFDLADEMAAAEVLASPNVMEDVQASTVVTSDDEGGGQTAEPEVQLRENLQETAFFYPQLQAAADGRVTLKFTLPESLTTWRFLGVAHTPDMMYGSLQGETVAQKDLMVQPNQPRFLRRGDQAVLSARIINLGQHDEHVKARLLITDPETGAVVLDQQQEVEVAAGATTSTAFSMDCSQLSEALLVCKWTVAGLHHSDGEQHYLPILPDRERVIVTVPFTQNEPGTKTIDLGDIVPSSADRADLTMEYTNNPAWLVVQALPTIGQPADDNAVSQAASLYANLLGRHLAEQNPRVKEVFEQWTREQGTETSLQSNLQKDQELKDLLLAETPWVLDARHEEEQKQLLGGFFDVNQMNQRIGSANDKLQRLQNADGSWSWWEGMPPSLCMTVGISEMLVRLNQMVGQQQETKTMLSRAFGYMGREMVKMVDEMKRQEKKGMKPVFPNHLALEWLYTCAVDGRQLPKDVAQANDYLKALLKKDVKNQTIYEKALSAIVLRNATYVKSLKEWTVYKEETGRYYDTPRASYSWRNYRIPTQVAAIEALQLLDSSDRKTIEEMQRWLLQEKRTTCWDTPLVSVDAIYAFMNGQQQLLDVQPQTELKVDGKTLETSKATAGIGYVKTTIPANGAKTFTAEKTSTGTSWGAIYAQFMQQTGDISDQQSGISVKRELLSPLSSLHSPLSSLHSPLKVGDRVKVRITIVADRDYDFVQVVDKRAACLEPVNQLSGYHYGYYCSPKDCTTNYYFDMLAKGKHVIETEYYIDREGQYETGTCTVQCTYSPEFRGLNKSQTIIVR